MGPMDRNQADPRDSQPARSGLPRNLRSRRVEPPPPTPSVQQQVGLALRADRRHRGQSQRTYAAERGLSRDRLARIEVDASGFRLDAIVAFLEGTGFELAILPVSAGGPDPWWDLTDVLARTRVGGRFPAHREVKRTRWGPAWYDYHERLGNRGLGPQPKWSAEGFTPPPGTRYGKVPTLGDDGRPRWPFKNPYRDLDNG